MSQMNSTLTQLPWGEVASTIESELEHADIPRAMARSVFKHMSAPGRVLSEHAPTAFAALPMLTYAASTGRDPVHAAEAACAMEMIAAAADVADDLQDDEGGEWQDRDVVSESIETIWVLLLLAHRALGSLRDRGFDPQRVLFALERLDKLMTRAMGGQGLDIRLEHHADVSIDDALRITRRKSATMVQLAGELGAILGDGDLRMIALCGRFGWHVGAMAQLTNDADAVLPGASLKSDIRLGKRTVPIVYAEQAGIHGPNGVGLPAGPDGTYDDDEEIRVEIWRSGAVHYAWLLAALEKSKAARLADVIERRGKGTWSLQALLSDRVGG